MLRFEPPEYKAGVLTTSYQCLVVTCKTR